MEEYILNASHIRKSFGRNQVLSDICLEIEAGEVHAIVGENGAGKSTFIKILSGEYTADGGEIILNGKACAGHTVREIQEYGLQVVHQNLNLVSSMSVMQNILLGQIPAKHGFLDWEKGSALAEKSLRMVSDRIDLYTSVKALSAAEKQMVVIARAIVNKPKILVLDEPTARLGLEETQQLFKMMDTLKKEKVTIIYITHRLEEIYQMCDRVSVFRDGEKILTCAVENISEEEMVQAMLGKKADAYVPERERYLSDETVLKAEHLTYRNRVKNVSLEVRKGEIVGLIGSVGAGKSETLEMIFGTLKPDSGSVFLKQKQVKDSSPQKSICRGIAFVPEDRQIQGLVSDYTNRENLFLSDLKSISKWGVLNRAREKQIVNRLMKTLHVKPDDPEYQTGLLSGGNQQKIAIGKWLTKEYDIYLMDEITSGVDVGAKAEIYRIISQLVKKGSSVLLSTSDMAEALTLCDRFIVLHRGEVVCEMSRQQAGMGNLLMAMMGEVAS